MKLSTLATGFALALIVGHVGVIALLFALWGDGFDWPEVRDTLIIVVPVFLGFTTPILKNAWSNRKAGRTSDPKAGTIRIATAVLFPLGFFGIIVTLLEKKANGRMSIDDLKVAVATIESAFGVSIGVILRKILSQVRLGS